MDYEYILPILEKWYQPYSNSFKNIEKKRILPNLYYVLLQKQTILRKDNYRSVSFIAIKKIFYQKRLI